MAPFKPSGDKESPKSRHPQSQEPRSSGRRKKEDRLSLKITALNDFGMGVGQKGGQIVMVPRTAPGDLVTTAPPRTRDRWTSADLLQVVTPGPDRVPSPCEAFDRGCGGCQWLHLDYSAQLSWKEKNVAAVLRNRGGYQGRLGSIVPMANPWGYRNKLSLKNLRGGLVFLTEFGGTSVSPEHCLVQTPALQAAWKSLKSVQLSPGVDQIHLRSNALGQVGIHAFLKSGSEVESSLRTLMDRCPGAVGMGVTQGGRYRLLAGEPVLPQSLEGVTWLIPHNGFFQTNEIQARRLLELVRKEARLQRTDTILDLYCGAGFFGLALAGDGRTVLGIEENPQSVEAAQASARHSGIANAIFRAGDLGAVLGQGDLPSGAVAVVDPPREGLLPRALEALVSRAPKRIVYVSCYTPSLARDFKALAAAGWRGISCTPIDMFPHSSHVEVVMSLER